jgi:hypothetical protein
VAVGDGGREFFGGGDGLVEGIDVDIVVADAVHFYELHEWTPGVSTGEL